MHTLSQVESYLEQHQLIMSGETVVVGVSGGPDSVVLLDILRQLAGRRLLRLHVAHLHHGLRGADADADAEFVSSLAEKWDLPYTVERVDLPKLAREEQLAIEEAARRVRYAFLARVAREQGACTIAVGHHAGDQAETILMHLLRGAGLAGLRGILPATPLADYRLLPTDVPISPDLRLIRPLLEITRAQVLAYCAARGLAYRVDRSNRDTTYFRNQLRHEVLPYLAQINPQISARLCNLGEVLRADYEVLEQAVTQARARLLVAEYPDALAFDLASWREQPLAIRRALIRQAAYRLRRTLRDVNFVHIANAIHVAQHGETGAEATLPRGLVLRVDYQCLTIADVNAFHLPPERPWLSPGTEIAVQIPGETPLPGDWMLSAAVLTEWELPEIINNQDLLTAWLDAETLGNTLRLRTRQPGDCFAPHGMRGHTMELHDFLINVKLPARWRNHLPLLTSESALLWVVGLRLSERALVRLQTKRVVRLQCRQAALSGD
ncbi:MAG: tRNA lysidine(34) synthetase TilS [Chloroflexota bacterium]|nr:tRNA lysidine(34) synthetase TilS [Chloroflexota bacterium]